MQKKPAGHRPSTMASNRLITSKTRSAKRQQRSRLRCSQISLGTVRQFRNRLGDHSVGSVLPPASPRLTVCPPVDATPNRSRDGCAYGRRMRSRALCCLPPAQGTDSVNRAPESGKAQAIKRRRSRFGTFPAWFWDDNATWLSAGYEGYTRDPEQAGGSSAYGHALGAEFPLLGFDRSCIITVIWIYGRYR